VAVAELAAAYGWSTSPTRTELEQALTSAPVGRQLIEVALAR
jgi:hypothetical protein